MTDQKNLLGKNLEFFECDHCPYKGYDASWTEITKPDSKFFGVKLPFCPRCGWEMRSERLGNMPEKPNKDDADASDPLDEFSEGE
jgi:hypothetical protein